MFENMFKKYFNVKSDEWKDSVNEMKLKIGKK